MSRMSRQVITQKKPTRKVIESSFYDYQFVDFDHKSVIFADLDKQRHGIGPRPYYVDITYTCTQCKIKFMFSTYEQKAWYEEYGFWNTAHPINCIDCRKKVREEKQLFKEFSKFKKENDSKLTIEEAQHLCGMLVTIYEPPLSQKIQRRLNCLLKKIKNKA